MDTIRAFVAHSFADADKETVRAFLDFFSHVQQMGIGFSWDHAEDARAQELPAKVLAKMEGKNLLIAICSTKELAVDPSQVVATLVPRGHLQASKKQFEAKTSDWITQEIGCAIGRGMHVMVLLEEGVRNPGGLQGELEYIPFSRSRPEASFTKVMEMLQGLKLPSAATATATSEQKALENEPEPQPDELQPPQEEPAADWPATRFEYELWLAVVKNDEQRERAVQEAYVRLKAAADEPEQARWAALDHLHHATIRNENRLAQILELRAKYPDNRGILAVAARAYRFYGERLTAGKLMEESVGLASAAEDKVYGLCTAARDYAAAGSADKAGACLVSAASFLPGAPNAMTEILEASSDVAKVLKDDDLFEAYTEALLEVRPDDDTRRFNLGFLYAERGEHDLAYYHYRVLAKDGPDAFEGNWNNLGVAAGNLQLPATEVRAYRRSEKLGGTLSMSNLARKLLAQGFTADAEQLALDAMKRPNYDRQVGDILARSKRMLEEESEKIEVMLRKLQPRRQFYVEVAKAALDPAPAALSALWNAPEAALRLKLQGRQLIAEGEYQKPKEYPPGWGLPGATKTPETVTMHVLMVAELTGRAGVYRKWTLQGHRPDATNDKPAQTGILLVSDDLKTLAVYEEGTREAERFYKITVGETPATGSSSS